MPKGENFFFLSLVRDKSLSPLNPHTPVLDSRPRTTPPPPPPPRPPTPPPTRILPQHTHTHTPHRPPAFPTARPPTHAHAHTHTHPLSLQSRLPLSVFFWRDTHTTTPRSRRAHATHTPRPSEAGGGDTARAKGGGRGERRGTAQGRWPAQATRAPSRTLSPFSPFLRKNPLAAESKGKPNTHSKKHRTTPPFSTHQNQCLRREVAIQPYANTRMASMMATR